MNLKKTIASLATLSIALGALLAYTVQHVSSEWNTIEEEAVVAKVQELRESSKVSKFVVGKYATEYVVVQSVTDDGEFLNAMPIQSGSQLEYGYILDNKYQLGDVVEITYHEDDLIAERVITGDELESLESHYGAEINAVLEAGIAMDNEELVMAEDGSFVPVSYYESEDK